MNSTILKENHFSQIVEKDIDAIFSPLKIYGISYFGCGRFFNNGTA